MSQENKPPKKINTYEDYSVLPYGAPYQLIQGELVMSPAPSPRHQLISYRILIEISAYLKTNPLGQVLYAPIDVFFNSTNVFQPDILYLSKENLHLIGHKKIESAPDFIIEILSPNTAYYDLKTKMKVYEQSGVKEYWIVDIEFETIEQHYLENSKYILEAVYQSKDEILSKAIPGLKFSVLSVFE